MSAGELLAAYTSGEIGRRAFIRGLAALGVSMPAAAAHAVALRSGAVSFAGDLDADFDDDGDPDAE